MLRILISKNDEIFAVSRRIGLDQTGQAALGRALEAQAVPYFVSGLFQAFKIHLGVSEKLRGIRPTLASEYRANACCGCATKESSSVHTVSLFHFHSAVSVV
jgi:hypothetical protein